MKKIGNVAKVLKLVIPIAPFGLALYLLLSLPGAVLPVFMLHLQKTAVDRAALCDGGQPFGYYMKPVLLMIGIYMIMKLFELVSKQYMEFGYFRDVFLGLDHQIHKKCADISLEYYDNAAYYDIVQNAKNAAMFLVFTVNLAVMSVILVFHLLSVGTYLTSLNPALYLLVVFVSVPVILEKLQEAKYQAAFMQDTVQPARRKKYAFGFLAAGDRKKEIVHYGAGDYIADKYLSACRELDKKEMRHIRLAGKRGLAFAGIKALFHCGALFLMAFLLIRGKITIGSFSVLLTGFASLTNIFTQLFHHAGEIMQTGIMSSAFFELMEFKIRDGAGDLEDSGEYARLAHVFYRYPNSTKTALNDISLTVKKGERVAIVGENGAGKTTLAKLLSGFLLPTEGTMELGGTDRRMLRERSIFEHISAVYQDYGRYKLTLAENVYLSDTMDWNHGLKGPDTERICRALEWADVRFDTKPDKMVLGKEFGGSELSGGQWQRIALARSYYRKRMVLLFDEPTAAIDPLEEMELYGKLNELAEKKTVILVTHRLGAVRNADKILVMENGSIAEMGNFDELIRLKGSFHNIWTEQTKWYKENFGITELPDE